MITAGGDDYWVRGCRGNDRTAFRDVDTFFPFFLSLFRNRVRWECNVIRTRLVFWFRARSARELHREFRALSARLNWIAPILARLGLFSRYLQYLLILTRLNILQQLRVKSNPIYWEMCSRYYIIEWRNIWKRLHDLYSKVNWSATDVILDCEFNFIKSVAIQLYFAVIFATTRS